VRDSIHTVGRFLRRHWVFTLILALGAALRIITIVAYRPAIIYVDSVTIYLNHLPGSHMLYADAPSPDPLGYNMLFLQPLLAIGNLFVVSFTQHLLGLAMAVVTYALLVRRGAWRWLAALATAPVLLDAYQLEIEHTIMSDTLFEALVVGAFAALLWNRRPGPIAIALSGLFLGAATTVRIVGAPLIAVFVIYLLLTVPRASYKMLGSALVALSFLVPVLGYSLYMSTNTATFSATNTKALALYARAATFVDCSTLKISAVDMQLCPLEPLNKRHSPDYYAHTATAPIFHAKVPAGTTLDQMESDFTKAAFEQQPLGLVRAVSTDAALAFTWNHSALSNPDAPTKRWQFQTEFPVYPYAVTIDTVKQVSAQFGGGAPTSVPWAASFLRRYQLSVGFMPGPITALCLLIGLGAALGIGRWRRAPNRSATAAYLAGGVLVIGAADFYEFSWRYQLPGLVLFPVVGVLGLMTLAWRPAPPRFPGPVDDEAIDAFEAEFGEPEFPPVVIVIAAFNEAEGIGAVLDRIPAKTSGRGGEPLGVATLVVVDGGSDNSAEIAREHGAYVCEMPVNRGQGAALRLGYYLARTGGAHYIVTTDADGQYDIGQLPELMEPLLADDADFVTGSRRLGEDQSHDQVRRTGVRVFALIVSVLTRQRITDTSFGFRAMRAEVTADVTLNQPQYQSSELLIGVISHGYRVVERPMTMRVRKRGKSKKGNNLLYGMRYARVVFSTWSRERMAREEEVLKTNRSRTTNFATNVTANEPK
jgi:hypothetical protein